MPYVDLVNNKANDSIFLVKEEVYPHDIAAYLKTSQIRKVVSTYNGLSKLIEAYSMVGLNIYDEFLLVDEWHVLFNQFRLRRDTIKLVLAESVKFKNKCFMTATPPKEREYWFKELEGLEEVVLELEQEPINLLYFRANNTIDEAAELIQKREKGRNLHIFINSVKDIYRIAKRLKLSSEDVKIVCANNRDNETKLNGYKIESTKDPVKKVNFYTSVAFEGCNIFDKKAKIIVLSDGYRPHTHIDMRETLEQIAGRIRDIEDSTVTFIYS